MTNRSAWLIHPTVANLLNNITRLQDRSYKQNERHFARHLTEQQKKDQEKCHRFFKTSSYEEQKNLNKEKFTGTCEWALKHELFLEWLHSSHSDFLVVTADPGCGKSVLARSLVDRDLNALTIEKPAICYFFFKDNEDQGRLSTALCALIHQLLCITPDLIVHAVQEWKQHSPTLNKDTDALWRILVNAISDPTAGGIFFVIDALDECQESDQLRLIDMVAGLKNKLRELKINSQVKFLITSRPYIHIQDRLRGSIKQFSNIHVKGENENDQIHAEINVAIHHRVDQLAGNLSLPSSVADGLKKKLLDMGHRTYLWLHLAMDEIERTLRQSLRWDEENVLVVPASVDQAYERMLSRSKDPLQVKTILQIIVGARRPLSIPELAMALGIAIKPDCRIASRHARTCYIARQNSVLLRTLCLLQPV